MKKQTKPKGEMIASEAIYGFIAWLTCRKEETVISTRHACSPIAELIARFCKTNKLKGPRTKWEKRLTHPD